MARQELHKIVHQGHFLPHPLLVGFNDTSLWHLWNGFMDDNCSQSSLSLFVPWMFRTIPKHLISILHVISNYPAKCQNLTDCLDEQTYHITKALLFRRTTLQPSQSRFIDERVFMVRIWVCIWAAEFAHVGMLGRRRGHDGDSNVVDRGLENLGRDGVKEPRGRHEWKAVCCGWQCDVRKRLRADSRRLGFLGRNIFGGLPGSE